MRYQQTLETGLVNIQEFVQDYPADMRQELAEFLEFSLLVEEPQEPIVLTPEEQEIARRAIERSQSRIRQQRRLDALNAAAVGLGFESWRALETAVINERVRLQAAAAQHDGE